MKASEIRQKWMDFFASKGHKIEPSAPLVPRNDPSLLWINAGMAPLKPYFDGRIKPDNPRIANVQKCIRTNDIENVGKTRRHHTFFEMLGNFSIGDYFKEEAITWSWEFLTDRKWLGLDPDRLSVTIHPEDEEAYKIWHEKIGLPDGRIYRVEDNFWDIGEGPCGPCTEIFYDRGERYGDLSDPECRPGGENERFLEVWNNVFSQFNHNKDGSYTPLPSKNIDTGAGLERFAAVLQDVDSNFDTDLFLPIILKTCDIAGARYREKEETDVALKVIADHIRAVTFAVGDGVLPGNEGRGYVIRRLLRRAVRYGKTLGIHEPFMYRLVETVGGIMGTHYPEVVEKRAFIEKVIRTEEERFHETIGEGLQILEKLIGRAKAEGKDTISGEDAFRLYDTYGFPLDLTVDFAAESGIGVDREGFEAAMEAQKTRARAARAETGGMQVQGGPLADFTDKSEFVGYTDLATPAKIIAIVHDGRLADEAPAGASVQLILDRTPFYAESGGQVSDLGTIRKDGALAKVTDVSKAPHGQHVMHADVLEGGFRVGDAVEAAVDRTMREDTVKNHTATHLLHKALREVLGDHVAQAGSLVAPDRLRFDFSHFGPLSPEELKDVERRVNEQVWLGTDVTIRHMPIAEAKAMGAMALFGEKYGDIVRVVGVGDYSLELCGGCHVNNTREIGLFKIVAETGIGSGVRRIEALTGRHAFRYMEDGLAVLAESAALLKVQPHEVPRRIESLLGELRELEREKESLTARLGRREAAALAEQAVSEGGVNIVVAEVEAGGMEALRDMADAVKEKLGSAAVLLGAVHEGKVQLIAAVTPDLVGRGYHAGKLVKKVAAVCGGGGGGRPDMAQAGGREPAKLKDALRLGERILMGKEPLD